MLFRRQTWLSVTNHATKQETRLSHNPTVVTAAIEEPIREPRLPNHLPSVVTRFPISIWSYLFFNMQPLAPRYGKCLDNFLLTKFVCE